MLKKTRVDTNNAPKAIGPYSQALIIGEKVYLSPQLGLDPISMDFVSDDILEQAHQCMKNVKALLDAAGTDTEHVIRVEIYVTDMSFFPAISQIFGEYFTDPNPPVRQTVGVRELPRYAKIMISCEAVLKEASIVPSLPNTFNTTSDSQKIAGEHY